MLQDVWVIQDNLRGHGKKKECMLARCIPMRSGSSQEQSGSGAGLPGPPMGKRQGRLQEPQSTSRFPGPDGRPQNCGRECANMSRIHKNEAQRISWAFVKEHRASQVKATNHLIRSTFADTGPWPQNTQFFAGDNSQPPIPQKRYRLSLRICARCPLLCLLFPRSVHDQSQQ